MDRPRLSSQACAVVESAHDLATDALEHWRACQARGRMTKGDIERHTRTLEQQAATNGQAVTIVANLDEMLAIHVAEIRCGLGSERAKRLRGERSRRVAALAEGGGR